MSKISEEESENPPEDAGDDQKQLESIFNEMSNTVDCDRIELSGMIKLTYQANVMKKDNTKNKLEDTFL